jgi:hypothetical protein
VTLAQLRALMTIRRAMGDAGQHVVLFSPAWDELAADIRGDGKTPETFLGKGGVVRGMTVLTCNGPTHVERIETTAKQDGVLEFVP